MFKLTLGIAVALFVFDFWMMYKACHTINIFAWWAGNIRVGLGMANDTASALYAGNPWYKLAKFANNHWGEDAAVFITTAAMSALFVVMVMASSAVVAWALSWLF